MYMNEQEETVSEGSLYFFPLLLSFSSLSSFPRSHLYSMLGEYTETRLLERNIFTKRKRPKAQNTSHGKTAKKRKGGE
jgi:hypothetical protein